MSTVTASVTSGYTFTENAASEVVLTKDRLNLVGIPSVTVDLAGVVGPADTKDSLKVKSVVVDIGGIPNSGDNKYLWIAPYACTISKISLVCDSTTSGGDGSNNYSFQVVNLTQTEDLLSTAKTTNGAEITGDLQYNLGANQNLTLAVGDVLELQMTENGTATDLTAAQIIAVVDYS